MNALGSSLTLSSGLVLSNRFVKSAMAEALATEHALPTPRHLRLYQRWVRGGAGLIVTGNVMVDATQRCAAGDVAISDAALPAFSRWAQSVTGKGTPFLMQLNHPGRQAPKTLTRRPVAPSAVALERAPWLFASPRAASPSEIEVLRDRFVDAAKFAQRAGFTGVEIHAGHGYLVSQFLSPRANIRRDRWGGSPEARMRFLLEVIRGVREATGGSFTLAVKLNAADFHRGGLGVEDSVEVACSLEAEGIDLLEVTGGTYASDTLLGRSPRRAASDPYFAEYVRALRPVCALPLLLTGGHRSPPAMRRLVDEGVHDLVGLARPIILEPDFPNRALGDETITLDEPSFPRIPGVVSALAMRWYTKRLAELATDPL